MIIIIIPGEIIITTIILGITIITIITIIITIILGIIIITIIITIILGITIIIIITTIILGIIIITSSGEIITIMDKIDMALDLTMEAPIHLKEAIMIFLL